MKPAVRYSTADFRRMGRGIVDRHLRCRAWWEPHLRCSREVVTTYVPQSARIAVLGAGRLLDVDLGALRERCREIHLFDADPACVTEWKRQAGRDYDRIVIPHIVDLTDMLEQWTRALRATTLGEYARCLSTLEATVPAWLEGGFDGIISLNLLGQIPLYWRDRVVRMKPCLDDSEWKALVFSMGRLQRSHWCALQNESTKWTIVISDTEYYFYHVDESHWRVEPAIFDAQLADTIFGSRVAPSVHRDSWLWHIAPQFIESDEEGEIHRVEARYIQW